MSEPISKEDAIAVLGAMKSSDDSEISHITAERILLEHADPDVAAAYLSAKFRVPFHYA